MLKIRCALIAATTGFCLLQTPTLVNAESYELAQEWPSISFQDGDKNMTLFMHMPDLDAPSFDRTASIYGSNLNLYIPLYALTLKGVTKRQSTRTTDVAALTFQGHPTVYKLFIRPDPQLRTHKITRPPNFQTEISSAPASLVQTFGFSGAPEDVLVVVNPEKNQASPDTLTAIELAAIQSLELLEKSKLTQECAGEPSAPGAINCWREKIRKILNEHKQDSVVKNISPFEQRYMQHRLSVKGYELFQRSLSKPQIPGNNFSLAQNWHKLILTHDIDEASAAPLHTQKNTPKNTSPAHATIPTARIPRSSIVASSAPASILAPQAQNQTLPSQTAPTEKIMRGILNLSVSLQRAMGLLHSKASAVVDSPTKSTSRLAIQPLEHSRAFVLVCLAFIVFLLLLLFILPKRS